MSFESFEKMTSKEWKHYIKSIILTDIEAMKRALLIVYENQTLAEKKSCTSLETNGIGFSRNDVKEMSRIAMNVSNGLKLKEKEVCYLQEKLPKYWKQIMKKSKENIASWKSIEEDGKDGEWKRVEILRYPTEEDWKRCKMFALATMGIFNKDPEVTEEWKHKILKSEHSPIRTLMFSIAVRMPYCNSVHYVRHKFGIEHYVCSQRNDRQSEYDRNDAPQSAEIMHIMDVNAQELMSMARRRLCSKADANTRRIMALICTEVENVCPEFIGHLVPMCEYQHCCPEFKSCGKFKA